MIHIIFRLIHQEILTVFQKTEDALLGMGVNIYSTSCSLAVLFHNSELSLSLFHKQFNPCLLCLFSGVFPYLFSTVYVLPICMCNVSLFLPFPTLPLPVSSLSVSRSLSLSLRGGCYVWGQTALFFQRRQEQSEEFIKRRGNPNIESWEIKGKKWWPKKIQRKEQWNIQNICALAKPDQNNCHF